MAAGQDRAAVAAHRVVDAAETAGGGSAVDEILGRGEVLLRSLPELAHSAGIMGGSAQAEGILWVVDPEAMLGLAMNSLMRRVARA